MEKKNDVISIIVPCHNEQEVLPFFLEEVEKVYNEMHKKYNTEFEYIFIVNLFNLLKEERKYFLLVMAGNNY